RLHSFPTRPSSDLHHVEYLVVLQIDQRGRVASLARKEVLIDTQHLRAAPARELGDATAHIRLIPALNRRAADPVSPGQALLTDTALMRLKDLQPIRLGGSITRANARESMTEEPIALFAVILRHPQVQHH